MVKGGVSDGCHHGLIHPILFVGVIKAGCHGDGGTHIQYRIHGPQVESQGIAADVGCKDGFGPGLSNGEKAGPVGASRAKGRFSNGQFQALHQLVYPVILFTGEGFKL